MTSLYVLAGEYAQAAAVLADLDLDAQTVADTLESLQGDFEAKAVNVFQVVQNLRATSEAIKAAEARMIARRKAADARADMLEHRLLCAMVGTGICKISCPWFELSVRDNPPAVEVFDAAQVPQQYMATPPPAPPPSPDKAAIKAAIKAGIDVAGCRLTRGQRLEVK